MFGRPRAVLTTQGHPTEQWARVQGAILDVDPLVFGVCVVRSPTTPSCQIRGISRGGSGRDVRHLVPERVPCFEGVLLAHPQPYQEAPSVHKQVPQRTAVRGVPVAGVSPVHRL